MDELGTMLRDLMGTQDDVTHLNEGGLHYERETRIAICKRNSKRDDILSHVHTIMAERDALHAELTRVRAELERVRAAYELIPCDERLPEEGVWVLVTSSRYKDIVVRRWGEGRDAFWESHFGHEFDLNVFTRWQPIPEPTQEGDK